MKRSIRREATAATASVLNPLGTPGARIRGQPLSTSGRLRQSLNASHAARSESNCESSGLAPRLSAR
jgi:hypothetical protein